MATMIASLAASFLPGLSSLFAVGQEKVTATKAEEQAMAAWTQLAYQPEAGNVALSATLDRMAQIYDALQKAAQSDPRLVTSAVATLSGYLGPAAAGGGGVGGLIPADSQTWQYISGHLPARGSIDNAYAVMRAAAQAGAPASLTSPAASLESVFGGGNGKIILMVSAGLFLIVLVAARAGRRK